MNIACPLCGAASTTTWLRKGDWHYRHCTACSAVWLDPLPSEAWAEDFYDRGYFEGGGRGGYRDYLADETQHLANARARVALARRFGAKPPGLWLDVGCAAGYTLVEARTAGFDVCGIDISPWARSVAAERFKLDVYATLPDAAREHAGQASVVTMFQVLEHLPDPIAALEQASASLRPGGLLLIESWDRASLVARLFGRHWQQISPPSVVWLFDRKSIDAVLVRAGLDRCTILATSKAVSVAWACGLLADKLPAGCAPALSRIARSRWGRLQLNYRLGDLVTVVATVSERNENQARLSSGPATNASPKPRACPADVGNSTCLGTANRTQPDPMPPPTESKKRRNVRHNPHLRRPLSLGRHDRRDPVRHGSSKRRPEFDVVPLALAAFIVLCGNVVLHWMRSTLFRGTDMTDVRWEQASWLQTAYLTVSSCLPILIWVLLAYWAATRFPRRYQSIIMIVLFGAVFIGCELDMAWYRLAHRHATLNDARAFISEFSSWRGQYGISTTVGLLTLLKINANFVLLFTIYNALQWHLNQRDYHVQRWARPTLIVPILIVVTLADSSLVGHAISKRRNQWMEASRQNPLRVHVIDNVIGDYLIGSPDISELQRRINRSGAPAIRPEALRSADAAPSAKFDILLLTVEGFNSTLADAEAMPIFTTFAKRSVTSINHYSSGNVTEYGGLGLLYGEPLKFYRGTAVLPWRSGKVRQENLGHSRYLKRLSTEGYRTQAIAPGMLDWAEVSNYVSDFTEPAQLPKSTDGVSEAIILQLKKPGPDFVFAYYSATHFPYRHSNKFSRFQPETPDGFNYFGWDLHEHESDIRNRYRNCLSEFDSWFARLLSQIDLERTIVVVTGDHGEEFFERGRLSHASSLDKPQISTPFAIHIPGRSPNVVTKVTSHVDVMETLLEVMGLPPEPGAYGRSIFLDDPLAHAAVAMMNRPEPPTVFAIVTSTRKILINIATKAVIDETDPDDNAMPIGSRPDATAIAAVKYFLENR